MKKYIRPQMRVTEYGCEALLAETSRMRCYNEFQGVDDAEYVKGEGGTGTPAGSSPWDGDW